MRLIAFLKNWTLPSAMAIGTAAYLTFACTPALDAASRVFEPLFDSILPLFMFLILFVTFCKVDFRRLRPEMWHLWVILFQVLLTGAVAALILFAPLSAGQKVLWEGMLTCIIGPTAAAAAVITVKIGGNLNSMTTYTFLSSFVTAALIPTFFPLIEKEAHLTFWTAFLIIMNKVCLVLVLPLLLGWMVRRFLPRLQKRITAIPDLGFYLWGMSLAIVTGTTVKNIAHSDATPALLGWIALGSLLLCLMQFGAGKLIGRRYGSSVDAGQALGQKNTAFAIWITYTYLNPVASVGPGCYILWQNLVNSVELWAARRCASGHF